MNIFYEVSNDNNVYLILSHFILSYLKNIVINIYIKLIKKDRISCLCNLSSV